MPSEPWEEIARERTFTIHYIPKADPASYVERVLRMVWITWWTLAALGFTSLVVRLAQGETIFPRDATDSATQRSGMALLTDYGTGCQYLGRSGALTVRLDEAGKPMCGRQP